MAGSYLHPYACQSLEKRRSDSIHTNSYIDGGWLQWGTPNTFSVASLLGETNFKAVIIMPAYRLNLFGFLYSSELEQDAASAGQTPGNHGFWDQRLALEWAKDTAPLFGGNSDNITISGYSAGAYSVFHQLAYDLRLPASESIIKQAVIWSNGPGVQPKSPTESQTQFTQLLSALNIPSSLPWQEKFSRLRSLPAKALLDASSTIQIHQFRPTTDSAFISPSLFTSLDNGTFATALKERNIRLLLGECRDEHFLYGIWHPPLQDTIQSLHSRLLADYPGSTVDALLPLYYSSQDGESKLPANCKNWNSDAFGRIYADMQVHTLQRGLIHSISSSSSSASPSSSGPGKGTTPDIYRYKISYRATCADTFAPREWGVTHATDMALWFFGNGNLLSKEEKDVVWKGLLAPFRRFVDGEKDIGWGTRDGDVREIRVLKPDGKVQIERDGLWDEAVRVWGVLRGVKDVGGGGIGARL